MVRFGAMEGSLKSHAGEGGVRDVFALAREAGLDGVELGFRAGYADDPLWREGAAKEAANVAREEGIDIPSIALLMLNQGSFAGDDSTRAAARSAVRQGIDIATWLGARTMLLPFFGVGKIEGDGAFDRVIEDCRTLAPAAEQAGVTLGLETTLPAPEVVQLVRAVRSPAVRAYFDIGNAASLGYDPVQELETLSAAGLLVDQLHVKDLQERLNDVPPGEGRVPYPAVVQKLREIGFDGWFVFETRATEDPAAAARRHRAFLTTLLAASSSP